jgi:FdhD protein
MRTPGADFELAAGFLYGEGVLEDPHDVRRISYCVDRDVDPEQRYNIVNVELRGHTLPDLESLERHFFTSSACGVCGKASLDALHVRGCVLEPGSVHFAPGSFVPCPTDSAPRSPCSNRRRFARRRVVCRGWRPGRGAQESGTTTPSTVVGWHFCRASCRSANTSLVSGRSSYEIMQKTLAARRARGVLVSAPSARGGAGAD